MRAIAFVKSVLSAALLLTCFGLSAAPFTNGSFEFINNHAAIAPSSSPVINPGDTWLSGWTVGGPGESDISVCNGTISGLIPYDGQQWIAFNGGNSPPGGILSQTFDTTVGQVCEVSFAVGMMGSGSVSLTATAIASGNTVIASNYCVPTTTGGWKLFQLNFTAISTSTTLIFKDTSPQTVAVDIALDDVTVTANQPVIPPSIVTSPVSQAVAAGSLVTLTASAGGGASSVQWYLINYQGTNAISGATNTTLNFTASSTSPGGYFAVFSNTGGSATTSVANLAVLGLSFVNGSFDSINHTAIASGVAVVLNLGDTWLTGWTVGGPGGGNLAVVNEPCDGMNAYNGQQLVFFDQGDSPSGGSVSQTFTTVPGTPYKVTFAVAQNNSGNMSLTATAVALNDSLLASNYCVPTTPGQWKLCELDFTATTTNTTLVFDDTSSQTVNVDLLFDDVTVLATPTSGPPVVNTSPVSQTVNSGAVVSFSASAAGSPSTLQWYFGANPVTNAGGTASPLSVTATDATAGSYTAVFSNSYGMATTAVAVLTVIDPPVIATSPLSQTVIAGASVVLTASASGGASNVQWYLINYQGTNAIAGATNTTLNFTASSASPGGYFAVFNNVAGSATTSVANLAVTGLALVNSSFESLSNHTAIPSGTAVAFNPGSTWLTGWTAGGPGNGSITVVNGSGGGLGPYDGQQWIDFNAGNSAPGGILSQTITTTVGEYYVVSFAVGENGSANVISLTATAVALNDVLLASNYCLPASGQWKLFQLAFTATSTNTTLVFKDSSTTTYGADLTFDDVTLVTPPVIVTSPVSRTNFVGTTATFSASASGSPATMQWFQGVTPILNATNATLSFTVNAGSGGNYTAVFTNAAGSATTAVATLTVCVPAVLTEQPQSITTNVGATVTFAGAAGGTGPLSFQWQFDGANISGATDTNLVLTNAQPANAGSYTLVVSNSLGTSASTNAVLTFISTIQVGIGSAAGAGSPTAPVTTVPVTVPVNLLAVGTENGVGFNLVYDTNLLTYSGVTLGSGASGAVWGVNSTQAGKLGVGLAMPSGTAFAAGTQQVVQVTFQAVLVSSNVATPIGFGPLPVPPGISDTNSGSLPAAWLTGILTLLPTGLEGDVAPVGNEDYKVTINDWVQEGLYVAGLQTNTNAAEFQRADCAPRDTLGDGLITVADWVQVGRYYLGLDPPTAQGGPTSPSAENGNIKTMRPEGGKMTPNSSTPRTITITPVTQGAITDTVSVQLAAQGNESALQFSVTFDPTALKYVSASAGNGASGGYLIVNTANVAAGQLGVVLSAGLGQTFAAGTQQIVTLKFNSVSYSNTTTSLAFTNAPVICQVVDANTGALSASYQNASLQVAATSWPLLAISQSAGNITLSWPSAPTVMNAQWSTNLGTNWTSAGGAPVTNAGTVLLTLPVPTNTTFFRLYGQ